MHPKPNILFIGDYTRADYLSLLDRAMGFCEFYFLYHTSPAEELSKSYTRYGNAVYWQDFKDVTALLKEVKPDKVLFLHVDSYNELILNLACKNAGIPTYLLEHGLRADFVLGFNSGTSPAPLLTVKQKVQTALRYMRQAYPRLRSRLFLINSIKVLSPADALFAKTYYRVRRRHSYRETYKRIKSPKRLTDYHISFAPKILDTHITYNGVSDRKKVFFIGIPYFDHLAEVEPNSSPDKIVLIDQPLAEHHLLKWTYEHKSRFISELTSILSSFTYTLYVKPHPKQDLALWATAVANGSVKIINDQELKALAPDIKLVLGFYSTYLLPFAAMPHTTLITFENHPAGNLNLSKPFTRYGVAKALYRTEALRNCLLHIDRLHQEQVINKEKFISQWLYKFDGKSGLRLRELLLSKVLPNEK